MLKSLAAMAVLLSATASAQAVTSYRTNNPAPIKGDANKIVCQKEETIGTRLGGKKVCLTVAEWQARQQADRDQTERVQSGTRVCSNPPCP
ncbi:MAG TPA: hypothetical protein VFL74_06925 [Sphingomicrobium sp.]|jgi:hypothetical protein|nr:hypothetical protein [Sphingomicrobium sp.]